MNLLELLRPYYNPDNGDRVLHVYIVGPYPTENFFRQLFSLKFVDKRTNIITFLVDKSSYDKAIEIKNNLIKDKYCTNTQFVIKAISGDKGRFVHSKMYYFEIEKPSGMIYTCLITGSGNASTRAYSFESDDYKNAEINLVTTIKQEDREFIENYFTFIENDTNILHITAADTKVYFPIIKYKSMEKQTDYFLFSNWVLSGYIYHQYVRINDLGKIRIRLENPIKGENTFSEKLLKNRSFDSNIEAHSISYTYINIAKDINNKDERDDKDNIKSKYFCETSYGYWAPKELKNIIDKKIKDNSQKSKRKDLLNEIAKLGIDDIEKKTSAIIKELQSVIDNIEEKDKNHYFKMKDNVLDKEYYNDMILSQMLRHNKKCKTTKFRNRYIHGYDSFNVAYLENCIDDLTDEVLDYIDIKLTSDKVFNLLCQAIKDILNDENYKTNTSNIDKNFIENNLENIICRLEEKIDN